LQTEIYKKEYAKAWSAYSDEIESAIWVQVNLIVTAGTSAALMSLLAGNVLGVFVFAGAYFYLSLQAQAQKKEIIRNQRLARTFYDMHSKREEPVIISEKRYTDYTDMYEKWSGYPSAQYLTVAGGEPDSLYLGEAVVVPPDTTRGTDKGFDYFFMTNNILAYNDRSYYMVTPSYGYGSKPYKSYDYQSWKYRTNTLGFLEDNVNELSDGQYNRIKPIVIDGNPAYTFVNGDDIIHQSILPDSTYSSPIVVSQQRYNEIGSRTQIISIDVSPYPELSWDKSYGYCPYTMNYAETRAGYKSKIELSDGFNYPITKITVDLLVPISEKRHDVMTNRYESYPEELAFIQLDRDKDKGGGVYDFTNGMADKLNSKEDVYTIMQSDLVIDPSFGNLYFHDKFVNILFKSILLLRSIILMN
jgi:hypothetical protein